MPPLKDWLPIYKASLASGQLSNFGQAWHKASAEIGRITGRHAVPVSSGTTALQIALTIALEDTDRHSKVAIADFTFQATLTAVNACHRDGVILKCDPYTWAPRLDYAIEKQHLFDTIIITSPFGYDVEFDTWDTFGEKYGKKVVYDLAGGWGMLVDTKNPCAMSFHATKNLCIGEGGVALFFDHKEKVRAVHLSNFDFDDERFPQSSYGLNAKLDEVHSSILLAQLYRNGDVKRRMQRKRALIVRYAEALPDLFSFGPKHYGDHAAPSLCALRCNDVPRVLAAAKKGDFVVRRGYWPSIAYAHMRPEDRITDVVCLPSDVTTAEFDHVVKCIKNASPKKK
jgi:dTDP-4-amino-4,6-dideoxygalactose transaminase